MAAKRGDADAFRRLVERYQRRVFGVALGILASPEDAHDACQEAFLRAYRCLSSFGEDSAFYTWLYRIVVNTCLDELRRRRPGASALDDSIPSLEPGPAEHVEAGELRAGIAQALGQLSVAHRTALVLREIEGLSYDEIADRVGCPMGTVMSRLFHARRRLQTILELHRPTVAVA
jgi:RNA polymerase sigma-70 factor (ECF subfamily)